MLYSNNCSFGSKPNSFSYLQGISWPLTVYALLFAIFVIVSIVVAACLVMFAVTLCVLRLGLPSLSLSFSLSFCDAPVSVPSCAHVHAPPFCHFFCLLQAPRCGWHCRVYCANRQHYRILTAFIYTYVCVCVHTHAHKYVAQAFRLLTISLLCLQLSNINTL